MGGEAGTGEREAGTGDLEVDTGEWNYILTLYCKLSNEASGTILTGQLRIKK